MWRRVVCLYLSTILYGVIQQVLSSGNTSDFYSGGCWFDPDRTAEYSKAVVGYLNPFRKILG
jgi:hypothetical protein